MTVFNVRTSNSVNKFFTSFSGKQIQLFSPRILFFMLHPTAKISSLRQVKLITARAAPSCAARAAPSCAARAHTKLVSTSTKKKAQRRIDVSQMRTVISSYKTLLSEAGMLSERQGLQSLNRPELCRSCHPLLRPSILRCKCNIPWCHRHHVGTSRNPLS